MDDPGFSFVAQLACVLTLTGYLARRGAWLRALAALTACAGMALALTAAATPLWAPFFWNALFASINLFYLLVPLWRARAVALEGTEDFLAKTALRNFPPAEVRSFSDLASEGTLKPGARMIHASTQINHLFCIVQGRVGVFSQGKKVAELGPGRFVGEMSLLTRSRTRADVDVETDVTVLVWTHEEIEDWIRGDATRLGMFQTALGTQVVEELLRQQRPVAAADSRSTQAAS